MIVQFIVFLEKHHTCTKKDIFITGFIDNNKRVQTLCMTHIVFTLGEIRVKVSCNVLISSAF